MGALLSVLAGTSAMAQGFDANAVAQRAWTAFKSACGQAVTDPQGYLDSAPAAAPPGVRAVAGSPDGKVVSTMLFRNGVEERVQFLGFSDRMVVFCHISAYDAIIQTGMSAELTERVLANPELMNDPAFLAQMEREMNAAEMPDMRVADTAIGAALAQQLAQEPGVSISGGAMPLTALETYAAPLFGDHADVSAQNYHAFAIETRFENVPVHAIAEVQHGGLWIGLSHTIGSGQ
ncbi:hypothetical protein Dshi_2879 [Dinoroseobacter shibae DFL 12 = DSM 16493]|jgi:hypothetical protein|uniref:Uncharacterized protein n=2 Tax=Dinoroseobacter shibae TaxID=215813 RepID=A8LJK9_DINSH|nr:hypothetical protein [Dinoroseobacter sp. PD6]ABV94612.1 hypothetical protein Dshi_2879 [Dinoroseobacter shibae DFL 12 = DSM 16493]MDD9716945.1 hypothetical protein [Dinoroseobacter sp. PD6]